jgi:hypothetical protein
MTRSLVAFKWRCRRENEGAGVSFDSSECAEMTAVRCVTFRLFHDCADFSVRGIWGEEEEFFGEECAREFGTEGQFSYSNEKFMLR